MASIFENTSVLKALYAGNALWHTSALVHFAFRGPFMMRKLALRSTSTHPSANAAVRSNPEGDAWHHDIMAYLGGMNSSLALLAAIRLYALFKPSTRIFSTGTANGDVVLDVVAFTVLGLANCSQAVLNFTVGAQNDRWICGKGLDRITVLDAAFTVLDWAAVLSKIGGLAQGE